MLSPTLCSWYCFSYEFFKEIEIFNLHQQIAPISVEESTSKVDRLCSGPSEFSEIFQIDQITANKFHQFENSWGWHKVSESKTHPKVIHLYPRLHSDGSTKNFRRTSWLSTENNKCERKMGKLDNGNWKGNRNEVESDLSIAGMTTNFHENFI